MVKKIRKLAYTYAVFSSVIIAFLFYFLMKGVSAVFDILPDLLVIDYIEELFSIIYPIGIVILFGFSSKLKSKYFFKGLLCGMVLIAVHAIHASSVKVQRNHSTNSKGLMPIKFL